MLRMSKLNGLQILDETKGQANGIASLTDELKVPASQIPNVKNANDLLYCEGSSINVLSWLNSSLSENVSSLDLNEQLSANVTGVVETEYGAILCCSNSNLLYRTKDFTTFTTEQLDSAASRYEIRRVKNSNVILLSALASNYHKDYVSFDDGVSFQACSGSTFLLDRGFAECVNGVYFTEGSFSLNAISWQTYPNSNLYTTNSVVYSNGVYFFTARRHVYTSTDLTTFTQLLAMASGNAYYHTTLFAWQKLLYFTYTNSQGYDFSIGITPALAIQNITVSGYTARAFAFLDGWLYGLANNYIWRTKDGTTWNYCDTFTMTRTCSLKGWKVNGVYILYVIVKERVQILVSVDGVQFTQIVSDYRSTSVENQEMLSIATLDSTLMLLRAYTKVFTYNVSTQEVAEYTGTPFAEVVLGRIASPRYLIGNLSLPMTL